MIKKKQYKLNTLRILSWFFSNTFVDLLSTKVNKTMMLTIICLSTLMVNMNAQGSPDAPLSSMNVSGENHATLKIKSDGYTGDTTEIKLTNMDIQGTGTEFVLRSINETGLVVSSNSDLAANETDNILTLKPNGDILIGNFSGSGTQILSTDNTGKLQESNYNFSRRTNLNSTPVNITSTTWSPVGPTHTFTKEFDHTIIHAEYIGFVNFNINSAFGVRVRVQIDQQSDNGYAEGGVTNMSAPEFTTSKSIFRNLPAGTYIAQVHARSLSGNATSVQIGPNGLGGTIWIEERL